jgi:DNA polymerase-3 subunit alpha
MSDFFHGHIHGEHSILDGYTRTPDIPKVAAQHGMSSIGLTDHGSLGGALQFWESAKEHEVKPIFGVEAYVTPDINHKDGDSPTWHLILLAQNRIGLNNLFALSKVGWTDGFYKKPRIDYKALAAHSDGILCLSACMASEAARAIEAGDTDEAAAALGRYSSIFPGKFYVELQPGNTVELNSALANLASDLALPTTVTVDSHYDHCSSKAHEELVLVMQQGSGSKKSDKDYATLMYKEAARQPTLMSRLDTLWPNRGLSYRDLELHIMTRQEVVSKMDAQGFDGSALADSTLEIAERCDHVEFETGKVYLPKAIKSFSSDAYLKELVMDGLEDRGIKNEKYVERANEELEIIKSKGFSDYFLIVWDVIREARKRNIYVGPGRGSAAGSLCAYALKITAIDPIKYKLLFSRFMDPERDDYPDIDMDFEHTRRDEMKTYME